MGMASFRDDLSRNRIEVMRREEATILREQQDFEYQASEEADRKEQQKRAEQERDKARIEREERDRLELEEAQEFSRRLSRESALKRARDALAAHPEPEQGPEIATVRLQLPLGGKVERRFHKATTVQVRRQILALLFLFYPFSIIIFSPFILLFFLFSPIRYSNIDRFRLPTGTF